MQTQVNLDYSDVFDQSQLSVNHFSQIFVWVVVYVVFGNWHLQGMDGNVEAINNYIDVFGGHFNQLIVKAFELLG